MKKFFLLLVPVLMILAACNQTPATTETPAATDSTTVATPAPDTAQVQASDTSGAVARPAAVFEESSGAPLGDVNVVAKEGTKQIEAVKTSAEGDYVFTKLSPGKSYNIIASKTGYVTLTQSCTYDGTGSLPFFSMRH